MAGAAEIALSGKNAAVGTKFSVSEVISKGTDLLRANPAIILIQVVPAIPALIGDVARSAALSPVALLFSIISAILALIASGAYAPVVKEALSGQSLTIGEALRQAGGRFWSLLGAAIVIVLLVVIGSIALVVPGIIFATWYAYTAPAIMLENKGALDGMSASRAFGRDKKMSTFLVFLVFLVAYIYIAHGPMATQATAATWEQPGPQGPAPPAASPTMTPAPPSSGRYCSNCGSQLKPDSRFCSNCGKPV